MWREIIETFELRPRKVVKTGWIQTLQPTLNPPPSLSPFRLSKHTIHGAVCLLNRYRVLTMKYSLKAKGLVQSEANHDIINISPPLLNVLWISMKKCQFLSLPSTVKSYSQEQTTSSSVINVMSDTSTVLTQQISELKINDDISRFLIPNGTILFNPDRKDNLYKVTILEHDLVRSKVR